MNINVFTNLLCLSVLLLAIAGCSSEAPADEVKVEGQGLVTEQTGEIQVIMPGGLEGPTETEAEPYTAEEKETYLKIQAEFQCDSMLNEPGEQQMLQDIARKHGMTLERVEEITRQLDRAATYKEVGNEAVKMCPEAFAPKID